MAEDPDFSQWAGARWPTLVRSAVLLGCSVHEAEDVTQTALLRCFRSWEKVLRAEDMDAYVYRVLLNCQRDSRRRRWWREEPTQLVPDSAAPTDIAATVVIEDAVERALGSLSKPSRAVVVLRFYAHLTEAQIAQVLKIPGGTVKSRLSRALTQLSANEHLADLSGRRNQ